MWECDYVTEENDAVFMFYILSVPGITLGSLNYLY